MKALLEKIRKILRDRRTRKFLMRLVSGVAAVVVFITTYALVLPAITMESQAACGLEAHQHDDSCYTDELICGQEESEGHHHTEDCYTVTKDLVCSLEEHQHSAENGCYDEDGNLICKLEEHTHTDSCYEEHRELTCGLEETEGHHHTDSCYKKVLVCGKQVHTHSAECYKADPEIQSAAVASTGMTSATATSDYSEEEYAQEESLDGNIGSQAFDEPEEDGTENQNPGEEIIDEDSSSAETKDNQDANQDADIKDENDDIEISDEGISRAEPENDPVTDLENENADDNSVAAESDDMNRNDGSESKDEKDEKDEKADAFETGDTAFEESADEENLNTEDDENVENFDREGEESASSFSTGFAAEEDEDSYIPEKEALDFNTVLNNMTGIYYHHLEAGETVEDSSAITDWTRVDEDTELSPEDLIRVYLGYTLPADAINATNDIARYRLPDTLHLTDEQIDAINKCENGISSQYVDYSKLEITDIERHAAYLGLESVEGSRLPDEELNEESQEFISATVKAENIFSEDNGEFEGTDLIFTFSPYIVEKNAHAYDKDGQPTRAGEKVTGWLTLDFNMAQIDWAEDNTSTIVFTEADKENQISEISTILRQSVSTESEPDDAAADVTAGSTASETAADSVTTDTAVEDVTAKDTVSENAAAEIAAADFTTEAAAADTTSETAAENVTAETGSADTTAETAAKDLTSEAAAKDLTSEAAAEDAAGENSETDNASEEETTAANYPAVIFDDSITVRSGRLDTDLDDTDLPRKTKMSVHVEADEGTFPEGTKMVLSPVDDLDAVAEAVGTAVDAKTRGFQAVDIAFYDQDPTVEGAKEIEPLKPIRVSIKSDEIRKAAENDSTASVVVHIEDNTATEIENTASETDSAVIEIEKPGVGVEIIAPENDNATNSTADDDFTVSESGIGSNDNNADDAVNFEADSFSIYAVVYTVDFHWESDGNAFGFSIPGSSSILLSKVIEALELPFAVEDVSSVVFSDDTLLKVTKVEGDTTAETFLTQMDDAGIKTWMAEDVVAHEEGKDDEAVLAEAAAIDQMDTETILESGEWILTALKAFHSDEELTISLSNGEVYLIQVTDLDTDQNGVKPPFVTDTVNTIAEGITITMFDYGPEKLDNVNNTYNSTDNSGINKNHTLKFYSYGTNGNTVNNFTGGAYAMQGVVQSKLGDDGYPVVNNGSETLRYLFDPDPDYAVNGKTVTSRDANYLFRRIPEKGMELFYDSDQNYAYLDGDNFKIYNDTYLEEGADYENPFRIGFYPYNDYDNRYHCIHGNNFNWGCKGSKDWRVRDQVGHYNHHFGMTVKGNFYMTDDKMITNETTGKKEEMRFKFSGDDDMWVFIDGVLVLDIGGIHNPVDGEINFTTGQVTVSAAKTAQGGSAYALGTNTTIAQAFAKAGKTWDDSPLSHHDIKIFYMERGGMYSNLAVTMNLPTFKPQEVLLDKVDFYTNEHLSGAQFELYSDEACTSPIKDKDTGKIAVVTSVDEPLGQVKISNLVPGQTYYFKEIKAPLTYKLDNRVFKIVAPPSQNGQPEVYLIDNGNPVPLTDKTVRDGKDVYKITNKKDTWGSFDFTKTDETDHSKKLSGAQFTLYTDADCQTIAQDKNGVNLQKTSDTNGTVSFTDIPAGKTYYMKETQEPSDYFPSSDVYRVVISDDGTTVSVYQGNNANPLFTNSSDGSDRIITNNPKAQYTSVSVEKLWSDGVANHTNDSVTVQLYKLVETTDKVTVNVNWGEKNPGDDAIVKVTFHTEGEDDTEITLDKNGWSRQVSLTDGKTYTVTIDSEGEKVVDVTGENTFTPRPGGTYTLTGEVESSFDGKIHIIVDNKELLNNLNPGWYYYLHFINLDYESAMSDNPNNFWSHVIQYNGQNEFKRIDSITNTDDIEVDIPENYQGLYLQYDYGNMSGLMMVPEGDGKRVLDSNGNKYTCFPKTTNTIHLKVVQSNGLHSAPRMAANRQSQQPLRSTVPSTNFLNGTHELPDGAVMVTSEERPNDYRVELNENHNGIWSYTWTGLDAGSSDDNSTTKITYYVVEEEVNLQDSDNAVVESSYEYVYNEAGVPESGIKTVIIANKVHPKTSITVTKEWKNQDGTTYEPQENQRTISFDVYQKVDGTASVYKTGQQIACTYDDASQSWKWETVTINGLPTKVKVGNELKDASYYVVETSPAASDELTTYYIGSDGKTYPDAEDAAGSSSETIVNVNSRKEIKITKAWYYKNGTSLQEVAEPEVKEIFFKLKKVNKTTGADVGFYTADTDEMPESDVEDQSVVSSHSSSDGTIFRIACVSTSKEVDNEYGGGTHTETTWAWDTLTFKKLTTDVKYYMVETDANGSPLIHDTANGSLEISYVDANGKEITQTSPIDASIPGEYTIRNIEKRTSLYAEKIWNAANKDNLAGNEPVWFSLMRIQTDGNGNYDINTLEETPEIGRFNLKEGEGWTRYFPNIPIAPTGQTDASQYKYYQYFAVELGLLKSASDVPDADKQYQLIDNLFIKYQSKGGGTGSAPDGSDARAYSAYGNGAAPMNSLQTQPATVQQWIDANRDGVISWLTSNADKIQIRTWGSNYDGSGTLGIFNSSNEYVKQAIHIFKEWKKANGDPLDPDKLAEINADASDTMDKYTVEIQLMQRAKNLKKGSETLPGSYDSKYGSTVLLAKDEVIMQSDLFHVVKEGDRAEDYWKYKIPPIYTNAEGIDVNQLPAEGPFVLDGITYQADFEYYISEYRVYNRSGDDRTPHWTAACLINKDSYTLTLENYETTDLTVHKTWEDVPAENRDYVDANVKAVLYKVFRISEGESDESKKEDITELIGANYEAYDLTADNIYETSRTVKVVGGEEIQVDPATEPEEGEVRKTYYEDYIRIDQPSGSWWNNGSAKDAALKINNLDTHIRDYVTEGPKDDWKKYKYWIVEQEYIDGAGKEHPISELLYGNTAAYPKYQSSTSGTGLNTPNFGSEKPNVCTKIEIGPADKAHLGAINTIKGTSIHLLKDDETDSTRKLSGVKFILRKKNGSNVFVLFDYAANVDGTALTINKNDVNGQFELTDAAKGVTITGLMPGIYELQEKKAPDGYIIMGTAMQFEVKKDGTLVKLPPTGQTVPEEQADKDPRYKLDDTSTGGQKISEMIVHNHPGASLPHTGGPGTKLIYVLGGMLTGLGVFLLLGRKRIGG